MSEVKDFKDGDEVLIKATVSSEFDQKFYKVVRCVTAENGEVVWCDPKELIKVEHTTPEEFAKSLNPNLPTMTDEEFNKDGSKKKWYEVDENGMGYIMFNGKKEILRDIKIKSEV